MLQVYLRSLHMAATRSGHRILAASPMMEEFITQKTPQISVNQTSGCIPFNIASKYAQTADYQPSTTLPQWMKDYFDWHREQTSSINSCNVRDYRFLVLRCSQDDPQCGGLADRLKSIPFFLAAAAKTNRIFLIRWQRPTKLEEFLRPFEINWSFPDWMYSELPKNKPGKQTARQVLQAVEKHPDWVFVEGFTQDQYGGSGIYHRLDTESDNRKTPSPKNSAKDNALAGWSEYQVIFRDLFYTLFRPSAPVERQIRDHMRSANLIPGKFSTSHYRAFYAVEHKKQVRSETDLTKNTRNAVNCASELQPGDPIYFASDSDLAVQFARSLPDTKRIVTLDHDQEALHLDKKEQWTSGKVSDFYPTFVDLLIMAEARCASLGIGGYGAFANMLSPDPTCKNQHDSHDVSKREFCEWKNSKDDIAPW